LRQATERAVQAERLAAIGLTVAGLAHEGRNALQAIHASAERLHWRLEENVEALDIVKVIQTAHDTLHRLFEDVRGYSAPIALCYRVCDLGAVWRGAWTQALAQQAGREAHLEEETDGCDLTLEADSFRIDQVFRNVFDNALTACPDPVRVRIRCTAADLAGRPALRLSIRDNGPGLNDEQKRRIFDAFYTTKTHGTGLGMAIAQRIIEAHGGHIEAGSPAGSGAEILIHLPRGRT
jgi:signal transduction histidine kinase